MERARPWFLLAIAGLWLALFRVVAEHAAFWLPPAIRQRLTLEAYLTGVQIAVAVAGVALVALVTRDVAGSLALRSSKPARAAVAAAAFAALVSPLAFAVAQAVAVRAALPTLMDEIARGGRQLAQSNSGQFGREIATTPFALVLVWGAVVSPVCEELVFRGALWSSLSTLLDRLLHRRARTDGDARADLDAFITRSAVARWLRARPELLPDSLATLLAAVAFAALHADMPGGLGIVRVVAAFELGLGCGLARQLTGVTTTSMALHAGFNAVSIGATRRVFDVDGWGKWLWVPPTVWVGGIVLLLVAVASRRWSKRA